MTARRWGALAGIACFLIVLLWPNGCGAQVEDRRVSVPGNADVWVPMTTPDDYAAFWEANLVCLNEVYSPGGIGYGIVRPTPFTTLERLRFYAAGDSSFVDRIGRPVYGEFFPPDTIVLAALLTDHPKLVRHEMLHAMGIMYHPVIPFVACGLWDVKPLQRGVTPPYPVSGVLLHGQ